MFSHLSLFKKRKKISPNSQCSFISSGTNLNNSITLDSTADVFIFHVMTDCDLAHSPHEREITPLTEHREIISNASALLPVPWSRVLDIGKVQFHIT